MSATTFFESSSELATLTNTFKISGVATDPTTIALAVTDPTGTTTTYTYAAGQITRSGAGIYTKDVACATAGEWSYVWTGTGAAADVIAGTWTVFETTLGRLYGTVEALKSRLKINDAEDDYELHAACYAAARSIEQCCERVFWRSATGTARTFEATSLNCLRLPEFNDVVSVSTLKTDAAGDGTFETTWASTDYQLWPYNPSAAPETRPYTQIKAIGRYTFPIRGASRTRADRIEVTGVFGWPAVPPSIKQAALILATELFATKDAKYGVAGYGDYGAIRVRQNPFVGQLLAPYKRNSMLVR